METEVVATVSIGSNGHRFSGGRHRVLVAAISRRGFGSRAEFLARYRFVPLPSDLPSRTGAACLLDAPAIGRLARLRTPFGVLEPLYPLDSRIFGMPRIGHP